MRLPSVPRNPLFRLLAINLASGIAVAMLMLGGLLALNPLGLLDLIVADRSGGEAIGLLLFGLVITFGSVAMGTAIMAIGPSENGGDEHGRGGRCVAPARIAAPRCDHLAQHCHARAG